MIVSNSVEAKEPAPAVALKVFSKWGAGSGEFVRALEAGKPSQAASSPA